MLKCKCCKSSDLGVTLIEIKKTPVKMVNGEPVGILADPILEQQYEVNYCFTCAKEITKDDLYENETCPVCGKEVPELVNGVCPDCEEEKNKLLNMSKEDLILMLMQQAKTGAVKEEPKQVDVVNDNVEKETEKKVEKKAATKKKQEPKEIIEEEVETAKEEIKESIKDIDMPDSVGISQTVDALSQVGDDSTETVVPPLTDDTDDILKQLDDINVDNLGLKTDVDSVMPF